MEELIRLKASLLDEDWCYITDFGLGKFSNSVLRGAGTRATFAGMGTPGYLAPETNGDDVAYSSKCDVFSLGCLLCNISVTSSMTSSAYAEASYRPITAQYPAELRDLISRCLRKTPSGHPSASEVASELCLIRDVFVGIMFQESIKPEAQKTSADQHVPSADDQSTSVVPVAKLPQPESNPKAMSTEEQDALTVQFRIAAERGDTTQLHQLLKDGAEIRGENVTYGSTALHFVVANGQSAAVILLLDVIGSRNNRFLNRRLKYWR
ncbi:uncharacterized protein RAG0_08258 [Rhynchosporium agropyri]|uniref:non-specific serine/threonine protein kinase n=1 Tax=Rhynchosporium agropyri TaxID=914238 RepID=A0A1E1KQ28_9HELO|nr:uncharacterized protein RAG0_08258 [Rhynchosporium agropyri]